MTFHRELQKSLAAVSFLAIAALAVAAEPPAKQPKAKTPPRPRVLVTISKETTYITEPLTTDGYPDYIAAVNRRGSTGVTPENNAVVPFFRAVGPKMLGQDFRSQVSGMLGIALGPGMDVQAYRREYCKMLGIAPLPEEGKYFIDADEYAKTLKPTKPGNHPDDQIWKQLDRAMERPWRAEELPLIAGWLAANRRPLDLLVQASARPRWYSPLVSEGCLLDATWAAVPVPTKLRGSIRALSARAMQRLQDGKIDEAWADLLAVHRLARLVSQGPTVLDSLVAITMDSVTCIEDQILLQRAHLTAAQVAKMRADLAALPPMAKMVDKLDVCERFEVLDSMAVLARGKATLVKELNEIAANPAAIDLDAALRTGNHWCDRAVATSRRPAPARQVEAWKEIDADLKKQIEAAKSWKSWAVSLLLDPRPRISEKFSLEMVRSLLPSNGAAINAEDRGNTAFDLTKLAFALAEYRARHGSYPAKLADLVPKYVAVVPKDIFSGGALHYKPQADGYLLYSVGPNGIDDGGRNQYDDPNDNKLQGCDDIAVRIVPQRK